MSNRYSLSQTDVPREHGSARGPRALDGIPSDLVHSPAGGLSVRSWFAVRTDGTHQLRRWQDRYAAAAAHTPLGPPRPEAPPDSPVSPSGGLSPTPRYPHLGTGALVRLLRLHGLTDYLGRHLPAPPAPSGQAGLSRAETRAPPRHEAV